MNPNCTAPNDAANQDERRAKFAVRIFHALRRTAAHPELTDDVGIAWCPDGRHFYANPKKLAEYLGLKSNSVNTNFRDHGFGICECPGKEIAADLGNATDPQCWKRRSHPRFSRGSTVEDAMAITSAARRSPAQLESSKAETSDSDSLMFSEPPQIPAVLALSFAGDREMESSVAMKIQRADGTSAWKEAMLAAVTSDWVRAFGSAVSVPIGKVLDNVLEPLSTLHYEAYCQLRANAEYLLNSTSGHVQFDQFLLLMLRYGHGPHLAKRIFELTEVGRAPQGTVAPNFRHWFRPELDSAAAQAAVKSRAGPSWIVRPSAAPNMFTVHCRTLGRVVTSHIRYDGLQKDNSFSIVLDGGIVTSAPSWMQLLFGVLELRPEAVHSPFTDDAPCLPNPARVRRPKHAMQGRKDGMATACDESG